MVTRLKAGHRFNAGCRMQMISEDFIACLKLLPRLTLLVTFTLLFFGPPCALWSRDWTNRAGNRCVSAALIRVEGSKAWFMDSNGKCRTSRIDQLCDEDRKVCAQFAAEQAASKTTTVITPESDGHTSSSFYEPSAAVPLKSQLTTVHATPVARTVIQRETLKDPSSDLIDAAPIKRLLALLNARNTVPEIQIVTKYVTRFEKRWYRTGRCCQQWCYILVPKVGAVQEQRTRQVPGLQKGIGWDDLSDPRLGFSETTFSLGSLPKGAAGRASRIQSVAQGQLPIQIDSAVSPDDRDLVASSTDFSTSGAPSGKERLVRVLASVKGIRDDEITLSVLMQQRVVNGAFDQDKVANNRLAVDLQNTILKALVK